MYYTAVINMNNPNALISMAYMTQNKNNPYTVFCEYIKYCIFSMPEEDLFISQIRAEVGKEFGLNIPYNVMMNCLYIIQKEGYIKLDHYKVVIVAGTFDVNEFDKQRNEYRTIETKLIEELVEYTKRYKVNWTFEQAREQLIKVLDQNGLACDLFVYGKVSDNETVQPMATLQEFDALIPDEDTVGEDDVDSQPLYSDTFYVGNFISQVLSNGGPLKQYMQQVCEGMMLCIGAYQLPGGDSETAVPQIKNTDFYFDTRLLLRFLGYAGEAAVEAARELVAMIQSNGGHIYYYEHTLEEMQRAFDTAINSVDRNESPRDEEMRLYVIKLTANKGGMLRFGQATIQSQLAAAHIQEAHYQNHFNGDHISFGFDKNDLYKYMLKSLRWEPLTISNDATSLWETHMRRKGDYSEYCGTKRRLPVFVTSNPRLIQIALAYKEDREIFPGIQKWKPNRLPVITDIKLTCRLWRPSQQGSKLSLLYLTANAVAAQKPTRKYMNTLRELVKGMKEKYPQFSEIPVVDFSHNDITNIVLEKAAESGEELNIGLLASSVMEFATLNSKEQEDIANQARAERDNKIAELNQQTDSIIKGAVEANKNKLGIIGAILRLIFWWPGIVALLFAGIGSVLSWAIGNRNAIWIFSLPIVAKIVEQIFSSELVERFIFKKCIPTLESYYDRRIERNLRNYEKPYRDVIVQEVKQQTDLWMKCQTLVNGKK